MGKENTRSSFDGKSTSYDYLRNKFNKNFKPKRTEDDDGFLFEQERDEAFQRYLYTGDKYSGFPGGERNFARKRDKLRGGSFEDKLFEAGIPPSQWDYYAKQAGIRNVNDDGDAKKLIDFYNRDERYQGPDEDEVDTATPTTNPVAQDFKDKYVDKVIEKVIPGQSTGNVTGGDNSIVAPIQQDNDITVSGNKSNASQNNSVAQMMKDMKDSLRLAY